jgi:Cof subfamily protein (haloacid dehalogenase superfamily)
LDFRNLIDTDSKETSEGELNMTEKKLILFDIDGTLLDHNKKMPITTLNAIKKLKDLGHYVAIATGRAPFMFQDIRKSLSISSYIGFNGQYVVMDGKPIYKNPLKKTTLHKLHSHSVEAGHPLVFMDNNTMRASLENHRHIHESLGTLNFNHPEVDPNYYKENDIYQTLLFCKQVDEPTYLENYPDFKFIRWHQVSTDVLPVGGSKAKGIEILMRRLGFNQADVIAFGDGLNDLEMLKFAGTGVAMGNGVQSAKDIANIVTKPVDEGGILHGLKMLKLL